MPAANLLLLLSPLLLLVVVVGAVAVVALNRAESKDVPEVARVFCATLRRLAERTPLPGPDRPESPNKEISSADPGTGKD